MILIKLGWAVFAPKNRENYIDYNYLEEFKKVLSLFKEQIVLVHWTWNFWHNFVSNYWLYLSNYKQLEKILSGFFESMNNIFDDFHRLKYNELNTIKTTQKNIIIWGDIEKNKIISSDIIFSKILKKYNIRKSFILTDVDWVLDNVWNIINYINKTNYNKISFFDKHNDVSGAMKAKVEEALKIWKKTLVTNWTKLQNFSNIINYHKGIFTEIN